MRYKHDGQGIIDNKHNDVLDNFSYLMNYLEKEGEDWVSLMRTQFSHEK